MSTDKQVHIIRHLAFEDLGSFTEVLDNEGYEPCYHEAGVDDLSWLQPESENLLVVLGGPISVNEQDDYPFLCVELELLRKRLALDKPTLGICLGAQLMAKALGAEVTAGPEKEIGWDKIELTELGAGSALRHLVADNMKVLHWHGETFDLPAGASHLACNEQYQNQAFAYGKRALALQFHPEVTAQGLEQWFIGHTGEIHNTEGLSVKRLRTETAKYARELFVQNQLFFREWLEQVIRQD